MKRYWYLASTLPSFPFDAPPPMSIEDFDTLCRRLAEPEDISLLNAVDAVREGNSAAGVDRSQFLTQYLEWERGVRNALVQLRARELKWPADSFTREGVAPVSAAQAAQSVFSVSDPLEAELLLERERWNAIEALSALSAFDLDYLLAYKLKLLIATRCAMFDKERGLVGFKAYYQDILHTAAEAAGSANDSGVVS